MSTIDHVEHQQIEGITVRKPKPVEPLPSLQPDLAPYRRRRSAFVAVVLCQLLALVGLTSVKAYTLFAGTTVTLRTVPVDPRDIFRGDYVALTYEISQVKSPRKLKRGDHVFVVLKKGTPYWSAVELRESEGSLAPDEVALRGTVEYPVDTELDNKPSTYRVHYGLEQAFVPEGGGRKLEQEKHLQVQVAVDRFGNAIVKGLKAE
jgi:uncharacterized membrane-anchored protein